MNDEKYIPENSDTLEQSIVSALRERQRKESLIGQWEKTSTRNKTRRIAMRPWLSLAVAASVALLLVFAPWHGNTPTPLEGWMTTEVEASRAAFPGYEDLAQALHDEDYNLALDIVNQSIAQSEAQKEKMNDEYNEEDEELAYERRLLDRNLEESLWVRICLFIQLHRIDNARQALEDYRKNPNYVVHSIEADQLLTEIKTGTLK